MVQAFSRLERVLGERGMSVLELHRGLEQEGLVGETEEIALDKARRLAGRRGSVSAR